MMGVVHKMNFTLMGVQVKSAKKKNKSIKRLLFFWFQFLVELMLTCQNTLTHSSERRLLFRVYQNNSNNMQHVVVSSANNVEEASQI
jgi:hypothetical protein